MDKLVKLAAWIGAIIFFLFGFIGLMNEPLAGLVLALMGLVLLPPFSTLLSRFGIKMSWIVKWVIITILFVIFALVAEPVEEGAALSTHFVTAFWTI